MRVEEQKKKNGHTSGERDRVCCINIYISSGMQSKWVRVNSCNGGFPLLRRVACERTSHQSSFQFQRMIKLLTTLNDSTLPDDRGKHTARSVRHFNVARCAHIDLTFKNYFSNNRLLECFEIALADRGAFTRFCVSHAHSFITRSFPLLIMLTTRIHHILTLVNECVNDRKYDIDKRFPFDLIA